MRRCEHCGRNYYYDNCPYCELMSGQESGRKAAFLSGQGYFWIVIIIMGFIAAVINPSSIIPLAGVAGLIWVVSRLGSQSRKNRQRKR
ncbi:hypothetical protein [Thermoclostridium caenicola]|uniref:Uncharacterized protein n=1 Tax=Thermoclostridium caenicola TaxID=659425 RepID=A0A1M6E3B9_9FIRM|nr:hypothetical protein [Thermoclostridium caenicola]SHI79997.1 hypothetical protein SAMN05444373_101028 [Thermoclostridium caenicola]HOP72180.1 hypothetical protein [Thermoclostridium caenicola]